MKWDYRVDRLPIYRSDKSGVALVDVLTSHGVIRTAGGRDGDEADIVIDTVDGALGTVSLSVCQSVRLSVRLLLVHCNSADLAAGHCRIHIHSLSH